MQSPTHRWRYWVNKFLSYLLNKFVFHVLQHLTQSIDNLLVFYVVSEEEVNSIMRSLVQKDEIVFVADVHIMLHDLLDILRALQEDFMMQIRSSE